MSVELSPHSQIVFPRPLTQLVKQTLQVTNPNNQPVAFKVKTTAPKQYCVRPNSGRIEPGEKLQVQVLLQPMKEEPLSSVKCKDKFLVQSTIIAPELETTSLKDLWPLIEKENKSAIHEHKIRCVYQPAATAPVPEEDESVVTPLNGDEKYTTVRGTPSKLNGASPTNDDHSFFSPPQQPYHPITASQPTAFRTEAGVTEKAKQPSLAAGSAAAAGAPPTAHSATRAVGAQPVNQATNTPLIKSEKFTTAELQAEISHLRKEVERLKSSGNSAASLQHANAEGVPIHIVAAIAFAVFAVTYVMF